MTEISFEVRGVPIPQGSKKPWAYTDKATGKPRAALADVNPQGLNAWRTAIAQEARRVACLHNGLNREAWQLLEGALSVECAFSFSPVKSRRKQGKAHFQRPDIDKLLRAVLDACTGVIWKDDAQVMKITGIKEYNDPPGCKVTVRTCDSSNI